MTQKQIAGLQLQTCQSLGELFFKPNDDGMILIFMHRRGIALAHLNSSIYAIGGLDDVSCFPTVERFDIVSNTWSEVCSMNCSRGGVAVVAYQVILKLFTVFIIVS